MSYMTDANAIAAQLRGKAPQRKRKDTGPSEKSMAVLDFCREFLAENDQLPPVTRINEHFGWQSLNAGQYHMEVLLKYGLLERNAVGKLRFARGEKV